MDENKRLREEILPLVRMLKDNQPLPTPHEHAVTSPPATQERSGGSSLSRKFSTKKLFLGSAPKNPSPTIQEHRALVDHSSLDPSAAAVAASSHLTASLGGGPQLSPTPLRNPPQHLPHTTKDKAASTTAKYLEARTITTAAQGGVKTTHGTQTRLLCPTVIAIPALRPHHCRHDRCETTLHQRRTLTIAIVTHHSLVAQAQ